MQDNSWQKDIAEVKTELKYLREDIVIMQKQVRDLNQTSNMGIGGLKVALFIGAVLGGVYTFLRLMK